MNTMRSLGMALLVIGILIAASWFIEPVRNAWPALWTWVMTIPFVIRVGLAFAVIGFLVLFVSLLIERARDRRSEGNLSDEP